MKKLDKFEVRIIYDWIMEKLENCKNPRLYGKALSANRSDEWRYRIGDYRLISVIEDERIIIHILAIAHRREVYKRL